MQELSLCVSDALTHKFWLQIRLLGPKVIDFIPNQYDSNSNGLQNRYTCQDIRTSKLNTSLRQKLQFSQWCTVIKKLFSIEKLLSSKCHMITSSKRDRLHVRSIMSRVTKCNSKTPWQGFFAKAKTIARKQRALNEGKAIYHIRNSYLWQLRQLPPPTLLTACSQNHRSPPPSIQPTKNALEAAQGHFFNRVAAH